MPQKKKPKKTATKPKTNKLVALKKFKNRDQLLIFDEKEIRVEKIDKNLVDVKIWAAHLKSNIEFSTNKNLVVISSFNKNTFGRYWQILFNAKSVSQQKQILEYFLKWYKDRKKDRD